MGRMKLTANIFGREFSFGSEKKSFTGDFLSGRDLDDNSGRGANLTSPYSQSTWIYVAINILAKNLMQIPFRISRGAKKGEDIIESGAVVDLFNRPHPTMDRNLFWANLVSWLMLRGEFFVLPMDNNDQPIDLTSRRQGQIKRLLTLAPDMFWHIVEGYDLVGWRYTGSPLLTPLPSEMLLPEEVICCRTFNPYLYWRGMSPMAVALLAAATDYASAQFMKGLMLNNADTGVIVTTDQQPSTEQREMFLAALRDRKRKAGTADRPLFLSGGCKVEKPTVSSADMQFLENRQLMRQEIGAIFGVPEIMMGFQVARSLGTGAGEEQERYNFIEATITPMARLIEAALEPIIKTFGDDLFGWFDVDSLPVMQEARRTRIATAVSVFGIGVPFNELNLIYDLGFKPTPWGNKGYVSGLLTELGDMPINEDVIDVDGEDAEKSNPFTRMRKLLADLRQVKPIEVPKVCAAPHGFEEAIAPSVKLKQNKISKFFFEQRGRVLSKLSEISKSEKWARALKGEKNFSSESFYTVSKAIDDIFDSDAENADLIAKLKPLLLSDLDFGGAQVWQEISAPDDFNLAPNDAIAFLDQREPVINDINATTWDSLKTSLQEGLANGESYDQLADRVKAIYNAASSGRAQTIALTETNVAINSGRDLAMKQAGVERKGWLTSHLENTRLTHTANEIYSDANNGIGIDETWPNGCDYPGDPKGAPGETINCRCVGYAIAGEKHFKPVKFFSFYQFLTAKKALEQTKGAAK